jgi:hypothetical protein
MYSIRTSSFEGLRAGSKVRVLSVLRQHYVGMVVVC